MDYWEDDDDNVVVVVVVPRRLDSVVHGSYCEYAKKKKSMKKVTNSFGSCHCFQHTCFYC